MTLKHSSNVYPKNEHGWPFKFMHIIKQQRTDSLRLPQGHRTGIVRFVKLTR